MTSQETLRFGFSPCPNDTFAFHALVHGASKQPATQIVPVMEDIEALNRRAQSTDALELTKLSMGAIAKLSERYTPLSSGAALGNGVGPLLVGTSSTDLDLVFKGQIAIPGFDTTAYMLLKLMAGDRLDPDQIVELRYDEILAATASGSVGAGLIIHESRFTYQQHGLHKIADLGEWWEGESDLPVPLAAICLRSDVRIEDNSAEETRSVVANALRASVEHAFAHPDESAEWVAEHAQEMEPDVRRQHIDLYVNEHTVELDARGMRAIDSLLAAAVS